MELCGNAFYREAIALPQGDLEHPPGDFSYIRL
jgi:hypothetical protein